MPAANPCLIVVISTQNNLLIYNERLRKMKGEIFEIAKYLIPKEKSENKKMKAKKFPVRFFSIMINKANPDSIKTLDDL
jgi:hypothetical protein